VALRSLIDFKGGSSPDPRINMSHRNDGRSIAVMVLLDLSESLNEKAAGCDQTILELKPGGGIVAGLGSREAGRSVRYCRISFQYPPRCALFAHQGLQ